MRQVTLLILVLLQVCAYSGAQTVTPAVTVYREFQPATVQLSTGKTLKVPLANIFLKNSSLLYKKGTQTMEAHMNTIDRVEFKDRTYYRLDTLLAYQVDTVGHDALYCAQRIDYAAWEQMIINNSSLTSLDLGNMLSFSTTDLVDEHDLQIPIAHLFFFRLNGQIVPAHERNLKRALKDKGRRRLMESVLSDKSFSWTDGQSLLRLLRIIQ